MLIQMIWIGHFTLEEEDSNQIIYTTNMNVKGYIEIQGPHKNEKITSEIMSVFKNTQEDLIIIGNI